MSMIEVKSKLEMFDLTTDNISNLYIKIASTGNCCIYDKRNNSVYFGFKLAENKINHTKCIVNFFPSQEEPDKFVPRLEFQIVKNKSDDIAESNKNNDRTRRIDFKSDENGLANFWLMTKFLLSFKDIVDTGKFDGEFRIVSKDETIEKIKKSANKEEDIINLSGAAGISIEDVASYKELKERRGHLEVFKLLLEDKNCYIEQYKAHHEITEYGEEPAWHHFLYNHPWVFGLNLDLRFLENFADEQSVGNPTTENSGNPKVDMTGFSDYTVLIEIKTAKAKIFTEKKSPKSRANTWSFSNDFIEGFSQCLGQKFDWEKNEPSKKFTKDNEHIDKLEVRTIDPKVIFLYGNKNDEIPRLSKNDDIIVKRDTFERFVRNNRNVEFVSYDELYRRAEFIINGEKSPE